ncbi:MAG: multidrug effflux MFS transporter [Acidobacteriota bacterium]|nr:multidrug effflux MFS transporter [Acidobacteriota bacterium]
MNNTKLLVLLTMLAALTALSTDIYLPSMPGLVDIMHTDIATVQMTLSVFLFSFALGQLIYGPLSDRYGRRGPLLVGLSLYLAANFICATASSIEVLLIGRFLQGLGACAGVVCCYAIVRDLWSGRENTRALSRIAVATSLAPIIAPVIGGFLESRFGWRASFLFLGSFSVLLTTLIARFLPETAPKQPEKSGISAAYRKVMGNSTWRIFATVNALSFSALFVFIGSSSELLVNQYGVQPETFGLLFALNACVYLCGSFLAAGLSNRMDAAPLAVIGCLAVILGGLSMSLVGLFGVGSVTTVLSTTCMTTFGAALAMPAGASGALQPFAGGAGAASALLGCSRFGIAAVVLYLLGRIGVSPLSLGVTMLLCGCGGLQAASFRLQTTPGLPVDDLG